MPFGQLAPKPKSALGYHRVLSPTAGVRVSPLCLGGMNFGESWKGFMGECSKETAFEMMDFFWDQGGNFIDTSNNYQDEESETWIGEWMEKNGNRDEIVLATKFTTGYRNAAPSTKIKANTQGNHAKSLHTSLAASLRKLRTSYVDILYLHWWDFTTSVPELMQSLNHHVAAGRVLYLGVSDTPAWVVAKANQYARDHGLRGFCVYQGLWNAACRDLEREVLPMCEHEGMAIAPWGALGGGRFKTKEEAASGEGRKTGPVDERYGAVARVLERLAAEKGTRMTSVALAYILHKYPHVHPIVGGRSLAHLRANIAALGLALSAADLAAVEAAADFDVGFPMNFLFEFAGPGDEAGGAPPPKYHNRMTASDVGLLKMTANLDVVEKVRPIRPRGVEE